MNDRTNNFILIIIVTLLIVFSFNVRGAQVPSSTDSIICVLGVELDTDILENYCKGWKDGYEDGYCYLQEAGCIKPVVPTCPRPRVNEKQNYSGGYLRGYNAGLARYKKEKGID